jgi:hypothetical protein
LKVIKIMDKKLLSLAVAAGLASSSAMAVDLDAGTGSNAYATELTIDAAPGTALAEQALNDVTVNAGFAISSTTERFMRFDISGATIGAAGAALAVAETIIANGSAGAGATESISAGGAVGDNFVIFEVKASSATNSVVATNNAVLNTPELDVLAIAPIGVTYALYSSAVDAVNNTTANALATKTGTIATATAATTTAVNATVAAATPAPSLIDVGASGLTFAGGGATSNIGQIILADVAGINGKDGTTDVTHATKATANALVVTGDFSATQDLTLGVPDGTYTLASVFLDHATPFDCASSDVAASAITATSATLAVPIAADTYAVCITTNGVSTINPGSYTGVLTPTAAANFTTPAVSLTLGTLAKNGSSTTLNLALSPTGTYPSFIRVSNTAAVAGDVTITLINDDGVSSGAFGLSTVAGQTTNSLGAGASTTLLSMADLMAAAQVASPTFASGTNSNKFRVTIDGEFGTIAAQSVTTSVDGNSFSTF